MAGPRERLAGVTEAMGRDRSKLTALEVREARARVLARRQARIVELVEKRAEVGKLTYAELNEFQQLRRATRPSDAPRRRAELDNERRRENHRQREIGR